MQLSDIFTVYYQKTTIKMALVILLFTLLRENYAPSAVVSRLRCKLYVIKQRISLQHVLKQSLINSIRLHGRCEGKWIQKYADRDRNNCKYCLQIIFSTKTFVHEKSNQQMCLSAPSISFCLLLLFMCSCILRLPRCYPVPFLSSYS